MPPERRQQQRSGPPTSAPEPEPEEERAERPLRVVSPEALQEAFTLLGVPLDISSTVSVSSTTVRSALQRVLDAVSGDIAVVHHAQSERVAPTWNQFQSRLRGSGLTRSEVSTLYQAEQAALAAGSARSTPQPSAASSSSAAPPPRADRPLDAGYVVMRTPASLSHLRGHHRCGWAELLRRFGLTHEQWVERRSEFYLPAFTSSEAARAAWTQQRLVLPIPVDPAPASRPASPRR